MPALVGKFYDQQSYTDVSFVLADGSTVQVKLQFLSQMIIVSMFQAHKLMLAITSSVFEAMFFGPLADRNMREVRVEDVKPSGFKRLIHFIYNSR